MENFELVRAITRSLIYKRAQFDCFQIGPAGMSGAHLDADRLPVTAGERDCRTAESAQNLKSPQWSAKFALQTN